MSFISFFFLFVWSAKCFKVEFWTLSSFNSSPVCVAHSSFQRQLLLKRQCSATQYCFFACGVPVVPLQRVDIISLDVYNSLKWTYKIMIHLYSILRKFKMFISFVIFENFPSFMTCLVNITPISGIPKNAWKTRRNIGNFAHRFAQPIKILQ